MERAIAGDPISQNVILDCFDDEINFAARGVMIDERGNKYNYVDQDKKRRIQDDLLLATMAFKIRA